MTNNNIKSRLSVLESEYRNFYQRFNEEIGEIRDVLKGKGKEEGLIDEVRHIKEEQRKMGGRIAGWVSFVTATILIIFQWVIPKVFA